MTQYLLIPIIEPQEAPKQPKLKIPTDTDFIEQITGQSNLTDSLNEFGINAEMVMQVLER